MKHGLQISVHSQPDEQCIANCMTVMTTAFDPQFGEAWTAPQLRSMMTLPGAVLVVGQDAGRTVGFGLMRSIAGESELLLLAVEPNNRRTGHGRRILDRCLTVAEINGNEAVFLEVRDGNPAVQLYGKAGFHQYNCRKDYYLGNNGQRYDALSLKLLLIKN
jgi:ribosomal-protein-alanine N-acetyltransferase